MKMYYKTNLKKQLLIIKPRFILEIYTKKKRNTQTQNIDSMYNGVQKKQKIKNKTKNTFKLERKNGAQKM